MFSSFVFASVCERMFAIDIPFWTSMFRNMFPACVRARAFVCVCVPLGVWMLEFQLQCIHVYINLGTSIY